MDVCMYAYMYVCMHVCTYVCMLLCMLYMYVCMYILLVFMQSTVVKAVMKHFKFKISLSWTVARIENPESLEV